MLEVHFRLANTTDVDLLVGFMQQFYEIDHYPFDEQIAREALKTLIEEPSLGRVWVINTRSEAIGYIAVTFGYSLEFHGRDAFIDELFLTTPHRNQGIGKETLQFVCEECHHLGIQALHLEVEHTNEAGQALYQKMGFESHEQRYIMTRWLEN